MREILFKAKRLNDGEWVEGNIVYVAEDADFMPGAYILPRLVSASAAPPTNGIMLGDLFVCEYTGLIDKNGKKIFEGDIVEGIDFSAEDGYGVVQWDDGAFEVVGNDICGTFHENYWGKYFEVIGNKFDGGKDDSQ